MKKRGTTMLLAILVLLSFSTTAFATGNPNIDGGGGGLGSGTSTDSWTPGMDGVRVSIVNAETGAVMGIPIDYTNKNPLSDYHFGKISKIQYRNGRPITPDLSTYQYKNPPQPLPTVVSSNGRSNIENVKRYFGSEGAARMIADDFGITFEMLTSGMYKLFLEPIAYFRFKGQNVAMTAHEAALYDQELSGGLRSRMVDLSHKNLPLAMFLERPDLGFSVFNGNTSGRQSNDTILEYLGMGTITYTEFTEPPEPGEYSIEYRVNTEVITTVVLHTVEEINYDDPVTIKFTMMGVTRQMETPIAIPAGESQIVWCRWTTPPTEQIVTITVETNKGYLSDNVIIANIVDYNKNPPPDPKADDRNDDYRVSPIPTNEERPTARWTLWWADWQEFWEWMPNWLWIEDWRWVSYSYFVATDSFGGGYWETDGYWADYGYTHDFGQWVDFGYWKDNGWWEFFLHIYNFTLTASSAITPDEKVPTASGNTMKSGYGINNTVTTDVSSLWGSTWFYTGAQTAISYLPEFGYETYRRFLDRTTGGLSAQFEFQKNPFSTYNQRSHFTPVWFPNETYTVYTWVFDAWTPAGMLSTNITDSINIQGSVFDDWQITKQSP